MTSRIPFFQNEFTQLIVELEPGRKILWVKFNCTPRPTVNSECLIDLATIGRLVKEHKEDIDYVVTGSAHPEAYNLGGDLNLFSKKIEEKAVNVLRDYAHKCIDIVDNFNNGFYCGVITIADVTGTAFGGGFEFALANNFILAKEQVRMGFPEISFGLFPGMGAYSLFKRRAEGSATVEKLIFTGDSVTSDEMLNIGVVDRVYSKETPNELAVSSFIDEIAKKKVGVDLLLKNRQLAAPVPKSLLMAVTDLWVDGAFKLSSSNIRYMKRLVYFQDKLTEDKKA